MGIRIKNDETGYICLTGCDELKDGRKQGCCVTTGKAYCRQVENGRDFCPCGCDETWVELDTLRAIVRSRPGLFRTAACASQPVFELGA